MPPRLFHFSEDDGIELFTPRSVQVPSPRADGRDWLNGPLVWAIDDWHQPMYLFPRDCPRVLLWRKEGSTLQDVDEYFGDSAARILAYVETRWLQRIESAVIARYELPPDSFASLEDAGMWVSREPVRPIAVRTLSDLPARLHGQGVELRCLELLSPLKKVWNTSLHASGIRLRNAQGWLSNRC